MKKYLTKSQRKELCGIIYKIGCGNTGLLQFCQCNYIPKETEKKLFEVVKQMTTLTARLYRIEFEGRKFPPRKS